MKSTEDPYRFLVFIAGHTPAAQRAINNINALIKASTDTVCQIETIDILNDPDKADENRILATPTTIRISPEPLVRIVGDLSDREQIQRLFDSVA